MNTTKTFYFGILISCSIFFSSCKKDFLDKKPATNLNVPSTLEDLQLLLDNTDVLNRSPAAGEVASDDYFIKYEEWLNQYYRSDANTYIWAKDIWAGRSEISDWNVPYTQVLYANVVLEQLSKINQTPENSVKYKNIKGYALFLRAWSFFDIAQIFTTPYDANTLNTDLGIPLRLSPDLNIKSSRTTIKQTYDQILTDANLASHLITNTQSVKNRNRPSKMAAYGLLSRIYLTMRDYPQAGIYADSALRISSELLNYNDMDTTTNAPFKFDNVEVIYQNYIVDSGPLIYLALSPNYSIDTLVYKSYDQNDLRKVLYFYKNDGAISRKNSYTGTVGSCNGITTDELLLTRAECLARDGKPNLALEDLNKLLMSRWKKNTYTPHKGNTTSEVLKLILTERRKELITRGLRWYDLRRLNKEGYNIVIKRVLNNQTYLLPPNDPKYAFPIPPDVIALSGIQQNIR